MNDQITSYSFEVICDYHFNKENKSPKNGDILFLQIEDFPDFVEYCKTTSNKHVIVSVRSDFGIEEQALAHPNQDIVKRMNFMDWSNILNRKDAYIRLSLKETASELCNPTDKYSVKIYADTYYTFNEVPDNVIRWFACNVNVKHPKIENVPFGLSEKFPEGFPTWIPKDKLIYVNFENHTLERKLLNQMFRELQGENLTYRHYPIAKEDYLKEMGRHKFVICPRGNGWDCWRNYETLYLTSYPIMEKSVFATFFEDLPVLFVDDYRKLNDEELIEKYEEMKSKNYNWDKLKLSYWAKRIKDEQRL